MKAEYDFKNLAHTLTITAETRQEEKHLEDLSQAKGGCDLQFERHSDYERALLTITQVE